VEEYSQRGGQAEAGVLFLISRGGNAWLALERRGRGYVLSSLLAAALAIPLSPRACSAELAAELAFPQGSRGVFLSRILGWLLL
jgi:hypothetical protein